MLRRAFAALATLALLGLAPVRPSNDARITAMVQAVSASRLLADDRRLVGFGTRNDFSETTSSRTHGVFAARDWLVRSFSRIAATTHGRMTVRTDDYIQGKIARTPRAVHESSVVAVLRGDEPGRAYVMSSHYDDCNGDCTDGLGVAPGADDNASGTSAVLEAARVMASTHFRGTIYFVCFDGEELGLWGSAHFAKELKSQGVTVFADLNNDIIGNTHGGGGASEPNVIRVFSNALSPTAKPAMVNLLGNENDSPSRELSRFAADVIPSYVPNFTVRQIFRADRFLRGGDQESFQDQGFPAIRFVEAHENFTHQHQNVRIERGTQYGDLPRYIDANYLARATQANVATLATLALGPTPPKDVKIVLAHLGYTTTLRWTPVSDATSYQIVWRSTTSPVWEQVQNITGATQATVDASYDDNIFAVRSVDAHGLVSPAVYPLPTRK